MKKVSKNIYLDLTLFVSKNYARTVNIDLSIGFRSKPSIIFKIKP